MKRIGITGGIASGKSEVANHLRKLGAAITDADRISREVTAPGGEALPAIRRAFGLSYFAEDGRLDRRKLGQLVFASAPDRATLEGIVHPIVQRRIQQELAAFEADGHKVAFLDIPLLYESGMEGLCDEVWVVAAPHDLQIQRLLKRDGLSAQEAADRIRAQMPTEQKIQRADRTIHNQGSLDALRAQVAKLYQEAVSSLQ